MARKVNKIIWGVACFLLGVFISLLLWSIKIDDKIDTISKQFTDQNKTIEGQIYSLSKEMLKMGDSIEIISEQLKELELIK